MGSPTFKKEVLTVVLGAVGLFGLFIGFGVLADRTDQELFTEQFAPYLRVLAQAGFFFTLYLIVTKQAGPYEIHKYLKKVETMGPSRARLPSTVLLLISFFYADSYSAYRQISLG